jgi:hypothetical protein
MFIGHFALGFAAKKIAPRTSLGTLLVSTSFLDVLWPAFLVLGWEHVKIEPGNTAVTPLNFIDYPISHSLEGALIWGLLLGGAYYGLSKYLRGTLVVGSLVVSHWILDWITHRPDLPLTFSEHSEKVGLGMWNSLVATVVVESVMFGLGVFLYSRATRAVDLVGTWSFRVFVGFLILLYVGNLFGPLPPNEEALAYFAMSSVLFYVWPYFLDRKRPYVMARE